MQNRDLDNIARLERVERITVGRDENGHIRAEITYRFAPPSEGVVESRVSDSEMFEEVPIPGF